MSQSLKDNWLSGILLNLRGQQSLDMYCQNLRCWWYLHTISMVYWQVIKCKVEKLPMASTMRSTLKTPKTSDSKKASWAFSGYPIILHDNATAHGVEGVTSLFQSYGRELLAHPPYSLDISPCDYELFPKLKENMRWIRNDDLDELEVAVVEQMSAVA
jgi:hypothetical protein